MSTTSKHAPVSGHKHLLSTREQRGLALFREGAVFEHGDLFTVRGAGRNYTVTLVDGEPRCDCPDFKARREVCKHGYSVVIYAAKKRCRRQRTATERPSRRHGMPRDDRRDAQRGSGPARSSGIDPAFVRANVARMGG